MVLAADGSSFELVVFGVVIVGVIVAAIALASNGDIYSQIGKGGLFEDDHKRGAGGAAQPLDGPDREAEIRQMLQARNERRLRRGEPALDIDAELARIDSSVGPDPALLAEIRDLVIARNHRRVARGEQPLDVDAEVQRQVRELGG